MVIVAANNHLEALKLARLKSNPRRKETAADKKKRIERAEAEAHERRVMGGTQAELLERKLKEEKQQVTPDTLARSEHDSRVRTPEKHGKFKEATADDIVAELDPAKAACQAAMDEWKRREAGVVCPWE